MTTRKSSCKFSQGLYASGILTGFICGALTVGAAAQQNAAPPDFSSNQTGWLTFNVDFSIVPGATSPLRNDPAHPRISNQEAARTGKTPT